MLCVHSRFPNERGFDGGRGLVYVAATWMPKRTDINTVLIIGAGPIIIGQACEFDYSGTQACKALKEEGYRVVLVNSNPATIMTDPDIADRTYVEPITVEWVEKVIEREKPDALLPTMGGQTALNVAMDLHRAGILEKHGVELIGADERSIEMAEDREQFTKAMHRIGLEVPTGGFARTIDEALDIVKGTGYPAIVRPSYTLGGTGGGISYNREELREQVRKGLDASPITEVLIDRSVIGWKEYELEVVRDAIDNVIIVCSIENFDPMGVHTGDSITVAPAQTLTDVEYQKMRNASIAIIREIGVEAGGCNIQFAPKPEDGEMLVGEMNPRVSRSSALASKATGFPIARVGAKLAVGYHLHELPNDITKTTPASFEPVLDYVVVKLPRFAFEKFPEVDDTLGIQMKSVGETMAIGRTFKEALQKALRGLETGLAGFGLSTYRFLVNSTLGMGGLFDVASEFKVPEHDTDFGETLYVWGVGEGPYIELPLIGPSTRRDTAGRVVDLFTNPLSYTLDSPESYVGTVTGYADSAFEKNRRIVNGKQVPISASGDSYAQARQDYLQKRRADLARPTSIAATTGPRMVD